MSDLVIKHSKYNIVSFDETTLEEYNDTVEISLCHRPRNLRDYLWVPRNYYYIKFRRAKANVEEIIELRDMCDKNYNFDSEFEDTCFYWYIRAYQDNDTSCPNQLPYIDEADFNSGAYITDHTFNHIDNTFTFQIRYCNSYGYFANKIQTIINKQLSKEELMNCFWLVTNEKVTFNMYTKDLDGSVSGYIEMCRMNDTKSFFKIALSGLRLYLYKLTKVR